jgi:outer membrane beta-barrel protein
MMKKTFAMRKVIALLLGTIVSLPAVARAEKERKSPLTDAPVIRRRLELRDKRFELGVGAGVTIGQDFHNALLVMPKLAFHFNDWLSLAVLAGYNVFPNWKSSFNSDVNGALPPAAEGGKSPSKDDAQKTMNHIAWVAMGQVEFIPLSGKIAILSTLFSYFDFYILAGAGVVNLAAKEPYPASCAAPSASDTNKTPSPLCKAVTGNKLTFNAGVGAHAFVARWAAINLELRDLIYKNNASGRSVLGNLQSDAQGNLVPATTDADNEWTNNYVFSLNVQFFLPAKAKISR